MRRIDEGSAYLDFFDAGHGNDVAGGDFRGFYFLQPFEREELRHLAGFVAGDGCEGDRDVLTRGQQHHIVPDVDTAALYAPHRHAAEIR
jgi:hypothetical protein